MLVEGTCTFGGGFLRRSCARPAMGACVYCGQPFCEDHGERGEDYIQVCRRKTCQAKWQDVRDHQTWREEAGHFNRSSICAHDGCEERMAHRCQRCRLMFCQAHLRPRTIVERGYDPPRRVSAMLCAHCLARRELWD